VRLTEYEFNVIKETFLDVFESGEIFLFGSRIDDTKRGISKKKNWRANRLSGTSMQEVREIFKVI